MSAQFGPDTALVLIDVQKGVHDLAHWGGPTGRMNNPACEDNLRALLSGFRTARRQVAFTRHNSVEPDSPLKFSLPSGEQIDGLVPASGDIVVEKSVNSGFIGTDHDPEMVHAMSVANLDGEFCTALRTVEAIALPGSDAPRLNRAQGNESTSAKPERRIA